MVKAPSFSDKEEVSRFIAEKNVKIVNLCHIPEDGRLKTLSFSTADKNRILEVLESGERVDGSSLFSFIDAHRSDIYIMPKLSRAFLNPFCPTRTLNVFCKYLGQDGNPLDVAPENVLSRAEDGLRSATGVTLKVLAELEFFIISRQQETERVFPSIPDRNYHESTPFSKFEDVRNEVLVTLSDVGVRTKYGHSEVGRLVGKEGEVMEQHEVELMPQGMIEMAETISVTKWVVRNVCAKHGVSASFSPKISLEHAGSGMHVHMYGLKNGVNIVEDEDGKLSVEAREMIGGIFRFAPSLAAFGNPVPVSYLRFLGRKESPMNISWGARNRMAMIRIPLWWNFKRTMGKTDSHQRTFEYRAPDAMANAYLLFAGISIAIKYGLKNHAESLRMTEKLQLEESTKKPIRLKRLPLSCSESERNLAKDRKCYEEDGVFPKAIIDATLKKLRSYEDSDLAQRLKDEPQKIEKLIQDYLHCG
jgi:glutamine synthetase